jgi:hypothetical protein
VDFHRAVLLIFEIIVIVHALTLLAMAVRELVRVVKRVTR